MSLEDFEYGRILGKGVFGSVLIVKRKEDNEIYAMKRVKIGGLTKKELENSFNEVRLLASLNHKNVIGYREAFYDQKSKTLNIVMEYADDGDLSTKIKQAIKRQIFFDEQTNKFNVQCYLEYENEKSYQDAINYGTALKLGDNFLLINRVNPKENNKIDVNKINYINSGGYKSNSSLGILASSVNLGTISKH